VFRDAVAIAHQMPHHKVLRFRRNLTNMLGVREREVRFPDVHLRSYSLMPVTPKKKAKAKKPVTKAAAKPKAAKKTKKK
jgi:hypothetical protein